MNKQIDFQALWQRVTVESSIATHSIHGPRHWRRVERNGLFLAARTRANPTVVRLFALFHDSRRINDDFDPGHGARGAAYAKEFHKTMFDLSDDEMALLEFACRWHTDRTHSDDVTIGTCWDADRLDLGRVGIEPEEKYFNTEAAKAIVRAGNVDLFLKGLPFAEEKFFQ